MRLIDADKIDFSQVFIGNSDFARDTRKAAQDLIDRQPTAYDVDEVSREIEEMKEIMLSPVNVDCFGDPCRESDCTACVLNRAIEIVKNGGKKQ